MKNLFHALAALALLLLAAPCMPAARGQQTSGGSYTTTVGGQPFGTEVYAVTTNPDGSRKTEAEASFAGIRFKATTAFAADNRPASFSMDVNGARAVGADFTQQGARVLIEGQPPRELKARADALLENGVWHQFIFLLMQYDAARGGAQSFNAVLPSQALEFKVTVERAGSPAPDANGRKVSAEQYRVATNLGLAFDVWADGARTPLVISVPSQRLLAVRKGSEDLAASIIKPAEASRKPSADDPFTSEEVVFQNGEQKLAGTLTVPKSGAAPFPAAVLISGSGAQERDGAGLGNIYRKIAERLSANGVAVLRADDRGSGASSMPSKPTSYRDLVGDSRAAFELLLARKEVDPKRVALVGHSEGATTAVVIAAEDSRVAAVASLAGIARPLDAVVVEQSLYMLALRGQVDPADREKMPQLVRRLTEMFDEAKKKPAGAESDNLSWFREHAAADLLANVKRVRVPLLVLNGERDENVLPHHAIELARAAAEAGNKNVRLRIFPNLSHVFAPSALDKNVTADKYTEVSDEFLQALQAWTTEVLGAGKGSGR